MVPMPNPTRLAAAIAAGLFVALLPRAAEIAPPAQSALTTPWTDDALAGRGWTEYPRPQLTRDRWLNLNGTWDYAITPAAKPTPIAGRSFDGKIRVPYPVESLLSGVTRSLAPGQRLWYRRTFEVPADWRSSRTLLHFGAVDYECALFVNGTPVGSHRGGYDPFTFDITDYLRASGPQELLLAVTDPTSEGEQPRGKQRLNQSGIWYTPASGIWQTVWLEPVPLENAIGEIRATPDVDASAVRVAVLGLRPAGDSVHAFRAEVLDGDRVVAVASNRLDREVTIPLPAPHLWSPADPHLYNVRVQLFRVPSPITAGAPRVRYFGATEQKRFATIPSDAVPIDAVRSYFGLRKISLQPGPHGLVLALNNQPLFEAGTLDQGYWPDGLLTPPTEAGMRFDLDFLKRAGFNLLRKHIKVEPALYYSHCDRIGLMVWQDMPSGMVAPTTARPGADTQSLRRDDEGELVRRSAAAEEFEAELRRMIDGLRGHPSIVMWVPFNEGWGQYDTARIAGAVKALDPTRLVNASSGWRDVAGAGDVFDIHTYREKLEVSAAALAAAGSSRASVVGEFGGLGLPVDGHLWWTDKRKWGYQTYQSPAELAAQYANRFGQIVTAHRELGISASIYTQTTDVEGEVNGLLTYDRRVEKIPAADLATIHATLSQP
jgi:beta-galactosidase/beta-glucuronidase